MRDIRPLELPKEHNYIAPDIAMIIVLVLVIIAIPLACYYRYLEEPIPTTYTILQPVECKTNGHTTVNYYPVATFRGRVEPMANIPVGWKIVEGK